MNKIKNSKGVLLINLGTPDSPSVKDVRRYLREFLMDGRVIDIPWWKRWLLIHLIIAPTRAPQSAKLYEHVWSAQGSPLKTYGLRAKELLQESLGDEYVVELGMRYQNPSIPLALKKLRQHALESLLVIPLYPQYASASTGSTIEKVFDEMKRWEVIPTLKVVSQFLDDPLYLEAVAARAKGYLKDETYDHVLFSYHGLPERQILKASTHNTCRLSESCCSVYHPKNRYCYRAQCFQTTRRLAALLNIKLENYTVCFQSRLGKTPWIRPYTDEVIKSLAARGLKKLLVLSPAFIADCLETTIEIGVEYQKLFVEHGGHKVQLVESLNDDAQWMECLKTMVLKNS